MQQAAVSAEGSMQSNVLPQQEAAATRGLSDAVQSLTTLVQDLATHQRQQSEKMGRLEAMVMQQTATTYRYVPTSSQGSGNGAATQYRKSVPLLLGTNVIRASKQDLEKRLGREFPSCLKDEHPAWHAAYQQVRVKSPGREPKTVSQVRYAGKQPVKIKPGEHRCITVKAPWSRDRSPYTVLIGPPDGKQFIKNMVVEEAVADVVHGRTLVHLYNQSTYNIVIKRGQTVASISALSSVETVVPSDPTPDLGSTAGSSHDQQSSSPPDKAPVQSDIPEMDLKEAAVLNQEQQEKLEELLRRNSDVFSVNQFDLGCTSAVKHEIPLIDNKPMRQPYRRIPPAQFQEVRRHLQDMVEAGAIRSSQSPYASPIVVARKKDGSIRVCIDYRQLNAKTVRDAFPMPRIEEALDALGDAEFYSTLDLTSGYWQVEVAEHDKPKTAFTTPMGLFECNRMPFGLQNAPATFQRLMTHCLGDLNFSAVLIYLDDVIVFSRTLEEHQV
ncbi:uncharacterized protein LOC131699092 [Acipenser ruthenus]|uniref:uncharacterized protein LOC131699091 n=1 Tax=Acipenser ruthenus TaxID=7906 RepID=UPI00274031C1|nr:uncharacterized protein LOC131699091 [Acipenser ruthenus]XP_058850829.1 uncharacterized protein LOC131699092 [Acipenser ruthenus]